MANEKFRREFRPLLLVDTAAFRSPGCGLLPRMSVGSGPSCFLFLNDGFSDFIAAGLGLVPRGVRVYGTSVGRFHVATALKHVWRRCNVHI